MLWPAVREHGVDAPFTGHLDYAVNRVALADATQIDRRAGHKLAGGSRGAVNRQRRSALPGAQRNVECAVCVVKNPSCQFETLERLDADRQLCPHAGGIDPRHIAAGYEPAELVLQPIDLVEQVARQVLRGGRGLPHHDQAPLAGHRVVCKAHQRAAGHIRSIQRRVFVADIHWRCPSRSTNRSQVA